VGEPVSLTLRLTEADGHPITAQDLALNHDQLLHVMVVDAGLEDYTHAHPEPQADGSFLFTFTPRLDRPYRLWTDFVLGGEEAGHHADDGHDHEEEHDHEEGHDHDHEGHEHEKGTQAAVDLPVGTGAVPAFEAVQVLNAQAGDLRFQLSLEGALRAGQPANVRLAVIDAKGQPFTGLEPLMGAFAHAVAFEPGATTMMHVHPEGAEPADAAARGGPVLAFVLEPEVAGPQRLFVQVRANGSDLTIPFTVVVGP
jgi:hypothetical protein